MAKRYEFGEKERHSLTVDWSLISKRLRVELYGALVSEEWHLSPRASRFELDVGSSEHHHVEVLAGGFHPTEVIVDGKKIPPAA